MELKTKTQIMFCCLNENLTTFLYTLFDRLALWQGQQENTSVYKSRMLLKKIWVLVFGFYVFGFSRCKGKIICYKCSNGFFVILHLKILLPCHGSDSSSHESNNYLCYPKLHFVESLVIPCYKCSIGLFVIFKFKFKKP
jgi:hypothetical protein